jgi:NADPH-dependent glutamate synthase beta subunit-like oxidoreductase
MKSIQMILYSYFLFYGITDGILIQKSDINETIQEYNHKVKAVDFCSASNKLKVYDGPEITLEDLKKKKVVKKSKSKKGKHTESVEEINLNEQLDSLDSDDEDYEEKYALLMAERVQKTENIQILMNTETDEVLGDGQVVTGVRAKNRATGALTEITATGFFVAIGHKPNTDIFADYLTLDETGYIVNVAGSSKTNVPGVFVAGDAADHVYRQAITAAGTGCMAALDAERYIASIE